MNARQNPELFDNDNPEWTDETAARARPASEVLPEIVSADLAAKMLAPRRRGSGREPSKVSTTLRLPRETLARWKASGPGWQTRMSAVLEKRAPSAKRGE